MTISYACGISRSVTTFSNSDGDTLLSDTSGGSSTQHWDTYNRYDLYANVVLAAQPSAFNPSAGDYDHSLPADLMDSKFGKSPSPYLNDDSGLIDLYTYYDVPNPAADPSQPSDAGLLDASGVQQGSGNNPDWQSSVDYTCFTGTGENADTVYVTSDSTQFQDDEISGEPPANPSTVTGAETTTYHYAFNTSNPVPFMEAEETVQPEVDPGDGGTGDSPTSTDVYNSMGQLVWSKDANGSFSYTAYDAATGAVDEQIQDVNFDKYNDSQFQTDYSALEAINDSFDLGWSFPKTGQNLVTKYDVDSQGRTIWKQDPDLDVTCTVYDDAARTVTDNGSTAIVLNETPHLPGVAPGRRGRLGDYRRGAGLERSGHERRSLHAIADLFVGRLGRYDGQQRRLCPDRRRAPAGRHDRVAIPLDHQRSGPGRRGGRLLRSFGPRLYRYNAPIGG